MKVTFSVIKTWYCCNDGSTCESRDVLNQDIVNRDIVAKASFESPSQSYMQTNSFASC